MKRILFLAGLLALYAFSALMLAAPAALAAELIDGPGDSVPISDGPATNAVNVYLLVLGGLVPLAGYVLNHFAPWATEQVKGLVQAALAAGVGVLYQAVSGSDLGLNDETLLAAVTAMLSALVGHVGWRAAGINTALGGGSNAPGRGAT